MYLFSYEICMCFYGCAIQIFLVYFFTDVQSKCLWYVFLRMSEILNNIFNIAKLQIPSNNVNFLLSIVRFTIILVKP